MMTSTCKTPVLLVALIGMMAMKVASHDYGDALSKCILFFEGQRSGKLPSTQRMTWRGNSALKDGSDIGVDLVGGYYDAGDNVKFNFPMAFTTTILAWSIVEFGQYMGPDQKHALEALQWSTDYFLKATSVPNRVVAQVGDPISDHNCWERPEDMDTLRTTYVVNETNPGSEVAGEIAAALAASSIAFRKINTAYSKTLLQRASATFAFGNNYRGSYDSSVGSGVCPFYCDINGYMDELIWAAAWLFKATNDPQYWNFVTTNSKSSGSLVGRLFSTGSYTEFGWDGKQAGINVLLSPFVFDTSDYKLFVPDADNFVCAIIPESPTKSVTYSPGGLLFVPGPSNLQHVTSLTFLLLVYARYLEAANRIVQCGNVKVPPAKLVEVVRGQADYVLGSNPLKISYMVGYSNKFPQKIHHRGSTLPDIKRHPARFGCQDGSQYFKTNKPNQNVLVGAIVGGPDNNDQFVDGRYNVSQSEPTTYINAPFVGVLGYLKSLRTTRTSS